MIRVWVYAVMVAGLVACATSPLGHRQLKLFPDTEMRQMGAATYQQIKSQNPVSQNPAVNRYVNCVSQAVVAALPDKAANQWEITVFRDDSANAFALPGGRIGVHTGLLKVAQNQDQLATVVGHEVAHVLADHANARLSTAYAAQTGLDLLKKITKGTAADQKHIFALLGVGAQVGIILPYTRQQESEADLLGLQLMARAGFDPRQSVELWRNMAQQGGPKPPQFLSTHPSGASRIKELQERMPRAMEIYHQARRAGRDPKCD